MINISIFFNYLLNFWYFVLLFLIIIFFKFAFKKGIFDKFIINLIAKIKLDKDDYHLMKDIILFTDDGTIQIDHIIISEYGIFVIITKNYQGLIYCKENEKQWIQKINNHTSKFPNPIYQNDQHIKTLQKLLNVDFNKFFSLIVFIGNFKFKSFVPENVKYGIKYIDYIKSKKEKIISKDKITEIITTIELNRNSNILDTNINNIKHIKSIVQNDNKAIKKDIEHIIHISNIINEKKENSKCVRCGGKMVLKVAKKGINIGTKFYGCSNYPSCRYTINISSKSYEFFK